MVNMQERKDKYNRRDEMFTMLEWTFLISF